MRDTPYTPFLLGSEVQHDGEPRCVRLSQYSARVLCAPPHRLRTVHPKPAVLKQKGLPMAKGMEKQAPACGHLRPMKQECFLDVQTPLLRSPPSLGRPVPPSFPPSPPLLATTCLHSPQQEIVDKAPQLPPRRALAVHRQAPVEQGQTAREFGAEPRRG